MPRLEAPGFSRGRIHEKKVDEIYDDGDFENLADEFIYDAEDCNRAENDVWAGLVEHYATERENAQND